MKPVLNYVHVLLYYSIGILISLKYLLLYCIELCRGSAKPGPSEDATSEVPKSLQNSRFEFNELDLKISGKDVHINYVVAGSSKNPLMLFLHGFPELWTIWKHQMVEFSTDFWTVSLDIKTSTKETADRKFLVDCIKVMLEQLGRNRCVLVGRDIGGSLIWSFLNQYPELVTKAVIINAPHPEAFKKELKSRSQVFKTSEKMFYLVPKLPEWSFIRNNFQKLDVLFKDTEISADDLCAIKYHFSKNKNENLKNGLNFYRSNLIADTIFRVHSKSSTSDSYPQCLIVYTKGNPNYNDSSFAHNYVKSCIQVTEIQTKHGHYFQLNEKSSNLLNNIIRNYFENPTKWETDWSEDKTASGNILKENFDQNDEEVKGEKEDVFDKLIDQCNETIENIKDDIRDIEEKKQE